MKEIISPIRKFDDSRAGTGTQEWSESVLNIQKGCSRACIYCYAAHRAIHRFHTVAPGDWDKPELTRNAAMTSFPKRGGVVMFPSAHDIEVGNLEQSIRVLRLVLSKGNQVLIVSKPELVCVQRMVTELVPWIDQIMFRFSIGSMEEQVCRLWEPGAPTPAERLSALRVAHAAGFRTSISAEPLLGGLDTAQAILNAVRPYVTDTVWIGLMNKIRQRVDMRLPGISSAVEALEGQQADGPVMAMFHALQDDPIVRWKDSIQKVVGRVLSVSEND